MKKNSIKERAKRVSKHIKAAVKYEATVECDDCTAYSKYNCNHIVDAFLAGYKYAQEQTKLKNK